MPGYSRTSKHTEALLRGRMGWVPRAGGAIRNAVCRAWRPASWPSSRVVPAVTATGTTRQANLSMAAYAVPVAATVASGCGAASPLAVPGSVACASWANKARLRSTPQR